MRIRPGLCSIALRAHPIEQVVDVCASAGLEGIEWGADVHVPPGDRAASARARGATDAAGIEVASYGSYWHAGDSDAAEIGPLVETAVDIGAPNIRVWCPYGLTADDGRRPVVVRDLADACSVASRHGVSISLEFHRDTLTERAADAVALVRDVEAPNLFSYWQPVEGLDAATWQDELATVMTDLSNLHVFWWESFEARWPLADGADLWSIALDLASDDDGRWPHQRWALIEYVLDDDPEQVEVDAATLRAWLTELP